MSGWGEFHDPDPAWNRGVLFCCEPDLPDGLPLQAGRYDGQPVYRTEHGLIYDADPTSADGCLLHPPQSFLGMPDAPLMSIGVDPLGFADAELQGEPPEPCPAGHEAETC